MAAEAHLPEWVAVLQALLVPVIAAVGTWIALQQMHLSRVRLRHDLFDRRFAILQATQGMLESVIMEGKISTDNIVKFATAVAAARFVFDDRLALYLREILDHASKAHSIQEALRDMQPGEAKQKAATDKGHEIKWLIDQRGSLGEKFQPVLQLERRWTFCSRRGLSR
ncbi:MAG: hypothetical protein ACP5NP_13715 [Acetobacteraceae bacterium]